jgi:hypothetical protein
MQMNARLVATLILGLGAPFCAITQAAAHGAIAIGGATSDSPNGSAYGISYSWATKAKADANARAECEKHRGKIGTRCEVVADYTRQWASVAMDPKGGTPGIGWGVDPDKKSVEAFALYRCKQTSPEDRKPFCAIAMTFQDKRP